MQDPAVVHAHSHFGNPAFDKPIGLRQNDV